MRRLILVAVSLATCVLALPSFADAQDPRTERRAARQIQVAKRSAEVRAQAAQRRAEALQRLQERRPQLKARIDRRLAQGRTAKPILRKALIERRMKRRHPEQFNRLDLNHDGRLQLRELRLRPKRIHRT